MDPRINDEGVLTIKALVMAKWAFAQLNTQEGGSIEVIGVANLDSGEWFIGMNSRGRLVKTPLRTMGERFRAEAEEAYEDDPFTGIHVRIHDLIRKLADESPQIFIK